MFVERWAVLGGVAGELSDVAKEADAVLIGAKICASWQVMKPESANLQEQRKLELNNHTQIHGYEDAKPVSAILPPMKAFYYISANSAAHGEAKMT